MHDMNISNRHSTDEAFLAGSTTTALLATRLAVELVIPVYNEQRALRASVRKLHAHLRRECDFDFRITIADNASTDETPRLALALSLELPEVRVLYLHRKGRGRALRAAWARSDADVVAYMDVDLSTDLSALPGLLGPLLEGRADLAIGSRLAPGAEVTRGVKRELISRGYNLLLRVLLDVEFSDAQCGFKAGRREVVQALLGEVEDEAWFFDTELLYRAQRQRLAIHEVPVRWIDDPDSRVDILATAREDLRGVMRLRGHAREGKDRGRAGRIGRARSRRRRSLPAVAPWAGLSRRAA
jgi:glycosyltransferase involved in cell wall biosynthesis